MSCLRIKELVFHLVHRLALESDLVNKKILKTVDPSHLRTPTIKWYMITRERAAFNLSYSSAFREIVL